MGERDADASGGAQSSGRKVYRTPLSWLGGERCIPRSQKSQGRSNGVMNAILMMKQVCLCTKGEALCLYAAPSLCTCPWAKVGGVSPVGGALQPGPPKASRGGVWGLFFALPPSLQSAAGSSSKAPLVHHPASSHRLLGSHPSRTQAGALPSSPALGARELHKPADWVGK